MKAGAAHEIHVDWGEVAQKLPIKRDHESRRRRKQLFRQFDPNGNGILSLAEVDKGIEETLHLQHQRDIKPVINRAFHAARSIAPPVQSFSDDYIDQNEFRVFLVYLRHYLELWNVFVKIDSSHDRRVSFKEFQASVPLLQQMGVQVALEDARSVFNTVDSDHGGMVRFDEFADWALMTLRPSELCDDAEDRADALALLIKQPPNLCGKDLPGMSEARFSVEGGISGQGCLPGHGGTKPPSRHEGPNGRTADAGRLLLHRALSGQLGVQGR